MLTIFVMPYHQGEQKRKPAPRRQPSKKSTPRPGEGASVTSEEKKDPRANQDS